MVAESECAKGGGKVKRSFNQPYMEKKGVGTSEYHMKDQMMIKGQTKCVESKG